MEEKIFEEIDARTNEQEILMDVGLDEDEAFYQAFLKD